MIRLASPAFLGQGQGRPACASVGSPAFERIVGRRRAPTSPEARAQIHRDHAWDAAILRRDGVIPTAAERVDAYLASRDYRCAGPLIPFADLVTRL